jgi:glycine/D-amino acid oxidase-like deaminating enzyme
MQIGTPLWATHEGLNLPPLAGDAEADVCVIGLGGSGLVCVNELLRIGARVIGIDAGEVGGGAAGRNGGFLLAGGAAFYHDSVTAYGHPRAREIYQLTLDEIDRIAGETPDRIRLDGSLRIAESDDEWEDCGAQLAAMVADGFPAEIYEGPEGWGLLIASDGSFDPLHRCYALAQAALQLGAQLFENTRALQIDSGSVTTTNGTVRATRIIVAVDGSLDRLLPELSGDVRTARLQMLGTAPTSEVDLTRPVYARWGYDYWQQLPDGSIALGGARDIGGESEWTHDTAPSDVVQTALEHRLRTKLCVTAPITHRWAASVSYTPDELPIVREVKPAVWAIGGYSGTGNVVGSLLGRGVARFTMSGDDSLLRPFLKSP